MAWKMDENKVLVLDDKGNPQWETDTGELKSVDYNAMAKSLKDANAESKKRKEELKSLQEKLAIFEGIEDLSAWKDEALKAIEAVKNTPDKDKELEAQIAERIKSATNTLNAQIADRDKKLGDKDKSINELTSKVNNLMIKATVQASKTLSNRLKPEDKPFIQRELERAGRVDDDGKVYFVFDDGTTILGTEGNATCDEAIPQIMQKFGIDPKMKLLSQDSSSGSGGDPNSSGGSTVKNPWKKETWNVTEQSRITRDDPALAERLRKAAGL